MAQAPTIRPNPGIPLGSPIPGIAPPTQLKVAPGLPTPAPLPPPSETEDNESFAIRSVEATGVTAYSTPEIAAITAGLTGPAVTKLQIETARRAIIDRYRADGYVYTDVEAVIRGDDLRFQIIEGYIADLKLDGDVGPAGTQVLRFLNHLVGEKPLQAKDLERWLLLVSDIPGLTIRSSLDPSTGQPGALTLVAQVSRRALSGYITVDNRAASFAGPTEGLGILSLNSFTEFGEQTQFSFYGAPGPNIFGQASSEFFVGGSGLKFKVYAGAGPAYPTGQLHSIGYDSMTKVFGGQFSYPVIRVRQQTLNVLLSFDAIETNTETDLGPNGSTIRASYDSLRIARAGFDYALLDTVLGGQRSATDDVSFRLSQGLDAFGASKDGDTTTPPPRLGEKTDFTKFGGALSRSQTLFSPFEGVTVALYGALAWQATGDILPPVEKFYMGGPHFNRGYYYGEVSGDKAITTTAELQLNAPIPLPPKVPFSLNAQYYLFWDWGDAWQNTKLESDVVLNSLGGGVRLFVGKATEIDFEGAYRGNTYPNGQGPGVSALRSAAFYWQASFRF